ncbi:hypothetical protein PaeBR_09515 [Paenibacillus sp. BR2-3]|uniref:hypothetical protein n=1 Tax=Paenibacillus sp. BR2-3 TaxID=3048494 RepID=UPI003977B437
MSPTMEKRSERLRTSTGFRWKLSFPSTSTLLNLDRDIAGILVHIPDQDHTAIPPAALQSCSPIIPPAFMDYWISLTSLEKMAQTDYDVLIVGSGAEGGAVLWRLCEQWRGNGKRVGVVERGNLLLPTHARNIATLDYDRFDQYFYNLKVSKRGRYPEFLGTTVALAIRTADHIIDRLR